MKAVIYPNFSKTNAYETTEKVCSILHDMGFSSYADERLREKFPAVRYVDFGDIEEICAACDVIIVIGGDGTIMEASSYAAQNCKLLLGINTGRLGFMASMETNELYNLSKLMSGDFTVENRMMIDCEYTGRNGTKRFTALNDIVISGKYSKLSDFNIYIDDVLVSSIRSDGLIFSTPTGSTAYALSAGGPILEPGLECIQMTPVCPHSLCSRTMIFSPEKRLELRLTTRDAENMYICSDGKISEGISAEDRIIISRSGKYLRLIDISGSTFYNSVNRKLMSPIKGI